MGIFDSIAGQVLGRNGGAQNSLLNAVMSMVGNQKAGGLSGLVEQFKGNGLEDIINSWVGTGKNLPITPEQIQQGLGEKAVSSLASQAGLSSQEVTAKLSQLLPQIVDKLTPDGTVSQSNVMSKGADLLRGLMK